MANVFISYAREDLAAAKRLHDQLKAGGHDPWLDREQLVPGQHWQAAIETAIGEAHFFIALLSSNSLEKRGYVQKELRAGMEVLDRMPDSQVFLIPVRIEECEPSHERLRELHWLDMFPDWNEGLQRLMKVFDFAPPEALVPDLTNTSWDAIDSDGDRWTFHLGPDGMVSTRGPLGSWDGTWRQSGDVFYMDFNERYAQYRGHLQKGVLSGDAQNVAGEEWTWRAIRFHSPKVREREGADVFISHRPQDVELARQVKESLESIGSLISYIAEEELKTGERFADSIREAIVGCREMCVICTPGTFESEWIRFEIAAAWALKKPIIPIVHGMSPEELPPPLNSRHAMSLSRRNVYAREARLRIDNTQRG